MNKFKVGKLAMIKAGSKFWSTGLQHHITIDQDIIVKISHTIALQEGIYFVNEQLLWFNVPGMISGLTETKNEYLITEDVMDHYQVPKGLPF